MTISKIMKLRPCLVATLLLASASFAVAQQKFKDASKVILALESKWNDAYKRGDIDAMNALLADDFIITVEDGATYSKAGYIAHLRGSSEHVALAQNSDVKVREHAHVAVVTGAYFEKGTSNGKPYEYRDRFTDVWVNGEGGWLIVASHYSISVK